jgi:hypothetical protein
MSLYAVSGTTFGFTVPTTGYYQVDGAAFYSASNTGMFQLQIWVGTVVSGVPSGSSTQWSTVQTAANTAGVSVNVSDIIYATSGQSIFLGARQNSGSTQTTSTNTGLTYLSVSLITQ